MTNKNAPDASRAESISDPTVNGQGTPSLMSLAMGYAKRGWFVFPCMPDGTPEPNHKAPIGRLVPRGQDNATNDVELIRDWWAQEPWANIGINCALSGLTVIDLDQHADGADGVAAWLELAGEMPDTYTVRTATGNGLHLYFERAAADTLPAELAPGVEVKHNGYVLAAGSVVDGRRYEVEHDAPVRALPGWTPRLLSKPETASKPISGVPATAPAVLARVAELVAELAEAPDGNGNNECARIAFMVGGYVGAGQISADLAAGMLLAAPNGWTYRHPAERAENENTIRRQIEQGALSPRPWVATPMPADVGFSGPVPADTGPWTSLDWSSFLVADLGRADWLAGDLFERGQQVSLVGAGKAGKSLLSLELAQAIASGRPFLNAPERTARRVLYIDQENGLRVVQGRIRAFGFDAEALTGVDYLSFPVIPPLDAIAGGRVLIDAVEHFRADVVFFDTVSRMIEGRESDSDTWLALYRCSLMPIKARGIATVRLDHFGKDAERGARGSSAKTQDVDHVWELTAKDEKSLRLRRTFTRTGLGESELAITRHGEKVNDEWKDTRHAASTNGFPEADSEANRGMAKLLDENRISNGRPAVTKFLRDSGYKLGTDTARRIMQIRNTKGENE